MQVCPDMPGDADRLVEPGTRCGAAIDRHEQGSIPEVPRRKTDSQARAAGLPLSYDIDRYLYAVHLEKDKLQDDENQLERFFEAASEVQPERKPKGDGAALLTSSGVRRCLKR